MQHVMQEMKNYQHLSKYDLAYGFLLLLLLFDIFFLEDLYSKNPNIKPIIIRKKFLTFEFFLILFTL